MKKIRLLIATGIFPPDIGGPATMLGALADSLTHENVQVEIITYSNGRAKQKNEPCPIYRIDKRYKLFSKFVYFLKLFYLAFRSDLIYVTDTYSVGFFCYLVGLILRKKYILRFTGDSAWEASFANGWTLDYIVDFQKKEYNQTIESMKQRRNKILQNAERVITDSIFMKKIAVMNGVKENKISVMPNSIDFEPFLEVETAFVDAQKKIYGQAARLVMTACRLTPWKGVEALIAVMVSLPSNVHLLILGDGAHKEVLERFALESKASERIHFLGRIAQDEIYKYYSLADVFVLNTFYEGISHVLLAVMKQGRAAIITTRSGGNPELIEDGKEGILIDYNNREQLQKAVCKILDNKNLAENFCRNAKKKLEFFSWKSTVAGTKKMIGDIVS